MKPLIFLAIFPHCFICSSHTASLEKIIYHIEEEIENFDGKVHSLNRILILVENELHFCRYEELCNIHEK